MKKVNKLKNPYGQLILARHLREMSRDEEYVLSNQEIARNFAREAGSFFSSLELRYRIKGDLFKRVK